VPLLLDLYPDAAAAYSLRKLRAAYSGPAIEARKTVGGETFVQDIGFVGNELDTASLLTFADGGDVFVAKWYDQSGGGNNDVAQVSESAQPQIVSNGVVVTTSGNYAIDFSGSTKTLVNATFDNSTQVGSVFTIVKSTTLNAQVITDSADLANRQVSGFYAGNPTVFSISKGIGYKSTTPTNTNMNLLSTFFDVNSDLYLNGVKIINSANIGSGTRLGFTLGSGVGGAASFEGSIFEVIVFDGQNKSSDRVGIESNINSSYNIYWDGSQTGLLDDYPSAAAAYSLRALNSAYTGPAIEARRSSDNAIKDIGFLYDGSLDTESLLSFAEGGDVFVAKWYDQSGNGNNDALQPSDAQQPQIVDLGSVVTLNGKPTILSSVGKAMYTASNSVPVVGDLGERSSFSVLNSNASGLQLAISYVDGGTNLWFPIAFNNAGNAVSRNSDPASAATAPYTANSDVVFTSLLNSTNSEVFINGVSGGGATGFIPQTGTSKINVFARYANVWSLVGQVSEIILYPSDQTANRVEIETNINNHYTIYP
jgi:hypothetical protein